MGKELVPLMLAAGAVYVGYTLLHVHLPGSIVPGQISNVQYRDVYGNPVEFVGTGTVVGGSLNDTSGQYSSGRT